MSSFVMAGGGTGGHILPALAVATELRKRGHDVLFIGVKRGLEARLVPQENFPIQWIDIGGLNRVGMKQTIHSLAKIPRSVWRVFRILGEVRPGAIFSTGGYVAGPVLLAAISRRIPVVVMEPNIVPGFTHRQLARFVTRALVSFPETVRWFPAGRTEITGLPVRAEFHTLPPKPVTDTVNLLVTGGSQGSQRLNHAVRESWPLWERSSLASHIRIVHQTGKHMYPEIDREFKKTGVAGEVAEFLPDMARAFGEADIVVARAGMGTLSELAAAGKPSILVPLPGAADDHQLKNARGFEAAGAARVILNRDMNGPRLVEEITQLASQPAMLGKMSEAARVFAHPRAAAEAADALESAAKSWEKQTASH